MRSAKHLPLCATREKPIVFSIFPFRGLCIMVKVSCGQPKSQFLLLLVRVKQFTTKFASLNICVFYV